MPSAKSRSRGHSLVFLSWIPDVFIFLAVSEPWQTANNVMKQARPDSKWLPGSSLLAYGILTSLAASPASQAGIL
jgi:hypothetical protein